MNVNVPQSGGAELEGEYFLAKPNDNYYKFTFIDSDNMRSNYLSLTKEQQSAMENMYNMLISNSYIYTCVGDKMEAGLIPPNGIHYTTYNYMLSKIGQSYGLMNYSYLHEYMNFIDCPCLAWQDGYNNTFEKLPEWKDIQEMCSQFDININSLFGCIKFMLIIEYGEPPTDEDVIAFMKQLMIEPITKEEYDYIVSRAESESY